jgi:hypothetical protein
MLPTAPAATKAVPAQELEPFRDDILPSPGERLPCVCVCVCERGSVCICLVAGGRHRHQGGAGGKGVYSCIEMNWGPAPCTLNGWAEIMWRLSDEKEK